MNLARLRRLALGVALAASIGPGLMGTARALELKGSTYFTSPPWKVDLVSYYTTIWQPLPSTSSRSASMPTPVQPWAASPFSRPAGSTIASHLLWRAPKPFWAGHASGASGCQCRRSLMLLQGSSASPSLNQSPRLHLHRGAQTLEQPILFRHLHVPGDGLSSRPQPLASAGGIWHPADLRAR